MTDYVLVNDLKILNICLNDGHICVACTESDQSCSALFVAFDTEGSEMCFNCINCNVKCKH